MIFILIYCFFVLAVSLPVSATDLSHMTRDEGYIISQSLLSQLFIMIIDIFARYTEMKSKDHLMISDFYI